ncbi:tannase-domain-containing protein [Testicularia cyperi]|uniref:Carboxylic ester hydrolase n=1 Tax=Testicularia cyperi TaxID=1882483 RepID=A0A317XVT7_9BASI|nr:tannase-domain-containing protein [Testicularia cyperi]
MVRRGLLWTGAALCASVPVLAHAAMIRPTVPRSTFGRHSSVDSCDELPIVIDQLAAAGMVPDGQPMTLSNLYSEYYPAGSNPSASDLFDPIPDAAFTGSDDREGAIGSAEGWNADEVIADMQYGEQASSPYSLRGGLPAFCRFGGQVQTSASGSRALFEVWLPLPDNDFDDMASYALRSTRRSIAPQQDGVESRAPISTLEKHVIAARNAFKPAKRTAWKNRLLFMVGGGLRGTVAYPDLKQALARYRIAVAGTNMGHFSAGGDAKWLPGNPEAWTDFGHRATHMTTVISQLSVKTFYGVPDRTKGGKNGNRPGYGFYSYFRGCSTGGRAAMAEIQRYPDDFDGVIAGSPAFDYNYLNAYQIHVNSFLADNKSESYFPERAHPLINKAVLQSCDTQDGVKDSVISDPSSCKPKFAQLIGCTALELQPYPDDEDSEVGKASAVSTAGGGSTSGASEATPASISGSTGKVASVEAPQILGSEDVGTIVPKTSMLSKRELRTHVVARAIQAALSVPRYVSDTTAPVILPQSDARDTTSIKSATDAPPIRGTSGNDSTGPGSDPRTASRSGYGIVAGIRVGTEAGKDQSTSSSTENAGTGPNTKPDTRTSKTLPSTTSGSVDLSSASATISSTDGTKKKKRPKKPPQCLTDAQIETVQNIYTDYYLNGKFIRQAVQPGSEFGWNVTRGVVGRSFNAAPAWYHYQVRGETVYDDDAFDEFTDVTPELIEQGQTKDPGGTINFSPELDGFFNRGGKLIHYHGLADQLVSPGISPQYYNMVRERLGDRIQNHYKLFMIPGMLHCRGGTGPCNFGGATQNDAGARPAKYDAQHDMFLALIDWVEKGSCPEALIGAAYRADSTGGVPQNNQDVTPYGNGILNTRLLCPYPQKAVLKQGAADTSSSDAFTCA